MNPDSWINVAVRRVALPRRPKGQKDPNFATVTAHLLLAGELSTGFAKIIRDSDEEKRAEDFSLLLLHVSQDSMQKFFWLFTYQPEDVLEHFAARSKGTHTWATIVELYEALWLLVNDGSLPWLSARDGQTAAAYLARTRWTLYALAYCQRPEILPSLERERIRRGRLGRLARTAREEWVAVLDAIEDYPLLDRDIDAAADTAALVSVSLDRSTSEPGRPTPRDAEVWRHCLRHHLLPRFHLGPVWRIAWTLSKRWTRCAMSIAGVTLIAAVALLMIGVIWPSWEWFGQTCFTWGAVLAAGGYLAIAVAAAGERSASWPWLLRQPASAAIGMLALTTMNPHWWHDGSTDWKAAGLAAGGLTGAAVVYLTVEGINHGLSKETLWKRVGAVALLGVTHAFIVAGMTLRSVVPIYTENGHKLKCLWDNSACEEGARPFLILTLAAGWAFAAGVFIQILWEDQASTAPLAHLGWRGRK